MNTNFFRIGKSEKISQITFSFIFLALIIGFFAALPSFASAQTLPICAQPNVGNFVPYIYDGELHSFDYTVFDNVRGVVVPLQTRIDGKGVEARYSSEWTLNGDTRVHVDVPGWEGFRGTFPVMVHVKTGPDASCETRATFIVSLPEVPQASAPTGTTDYGTGGPVPSDSLSESAETTTSMETETMTGSVTDPTIEISISDEDPEGETNDDINIISDTPEEETVISEDNETADKKTSGFLALFAPINPEGSSCKTLPLLSWILLAVLHLIIAGAILFFLRSLISESNLWFTIALLVPFIGFLLAWFLLDGCRIHQWFPVVVALISLGTVLGVPASDNEPKKIAASTVDTSGGPVMKMPPASDDTKESEQKEKVIKF